MGRTNVMVTPEIIFVGMIGGMLSSISGIKAGDRVTLITETTYSQVEGLKKGVPYTVSETDGGPGGRSNYIKIRETKGNYWVEITSFARYVDTPSTGITIPPPKEGPVIKDGVADWNGCTHLIKVGMELIVVNDHSHWISTGGLKIGDVVKLSGFSIGSFSVPTPKFGNLTIPRSCFGLPGQCTVGSVFIKHQIKIKQYERTSTPRRVQVPRQIAAVRSAKSGSGRRVCS